jgi:hypothetical protein
VKDDQTETLICDDGNGNIVFFQADRIHGFSVAGDRALFHQPPTISLVKKCFDSACISWCKNRVQKETLSGWQG